MSIQRMRSNFFSGPAEREMKAANKNMQEDNTLEVARGFLQSIEGSRATTENECIMSGIVGLGAGVFLYCAWPAELFLLLLLPAANIAANYSDHLIYEQIRTSCGKWLTNKLGEDKVGKIEDISRKYALTESDFGFGGVERKNALKQAALETIVNESQLQRRPS